MTETAIKHELSNIRYGLEYLTFCERIYDPDFNFILKPYSKRRTRLIKTYWTLKAMQQK